MNILPMSDVKIFSSTASRYLSDKISEYYGRPLGNIEMTYFSDGEMAPTIKESVRGAFVFFIASTAAPSDNIMELLLMIDAAKRASASYITAVIPYYGYARQDRKDKSRVPISAKMIADLLEKVGVDRVMTMEMHADQLQGFFDIPVDHLKSDAIFLPYLNEQNLDSVVFAAPDVGAVKRARVYAKHYGKNLVICDKYRKKANEIAEMTVIGDVEGADVILVDDLVDTAGTLCRAAKIIKDHGAKSVKALCTHPVLSGKAYETIEDSELEEMIVCDTLPLKPEKIQNKITVLTTSKLFAQAIRNVHEHRSISALFVERG